MNKARSPASAASRAGAGAGRLVRAWRALPHERRLAAYAAVGLFLTLFLPWYQETVVTAGRQTSASLTGWGAFSFVEAALLLVAAAVLTLLFQRAEGRAFHVPGGDGWVISLAGFWTCLLVVWRIFDKQSVQVKAPGATVSGVEWGIFAALAVAALLVYAGSRIRAAHQPEPPLPGEAPAGKSSAAPPGPRPRPSRPPRPVRAPAGGAAEIFGAPVVPDDPPAVPFGRVQPATPRARARPAATEAQHATRRTRPPATEEQLTIPLEDERTQVQRPDG